MEPICEQPLVVITGPTASGKTGISLELAEEFGGEIICADSRSVYKEMDIGTAKPTKEEQARVPHHLLDVVEPGELFSAADFKQLALEAIKNIRQRGKIPFLVGGTGLYVDAVIFDYQFGGKADTELRAWLEQMSVEELQEYCNKNNVELPENTKNKRYLIRAIEQKGVNNRSRQEPIENCIVVGIATEKHELRQRIEDRTDGFFASGVVEEAIKIGQKYGWKSEAMTGNIYRLAKDIHEANMTIPEAKEKFITLDWRLAKRQLTWLRRNKYIHWLGREEAKSYLEDYLKRRKTC